MSNNSYSLFCPIMFSLVIIIAGKKLKINESCFIPEANSVFDQCPVFGPQEVNVLRLRDQTVRPI